MGSSEPKPAPKPDHTVKTGLGPPCPHHQFHSHRSVRPLPVRGILLLVPERTASVGGALNARKPRSYIKAGKGRRFERLGRRMPGTL